MQRTLTKLGLYKDKDRWQAGMQTRSGARVLIRGQSV
jgi:hypothetical protein